MMDHDITLYALQLPDLFPQFREDKRFRKDAQKQRGFPREHRPRKRVLPGESRGMLAAEGAKPYHNKKDLLWQWVLEDVFDDFLTFFFPDARDHFDLDRGFEWLDKDLEQLFPPDNEQYMPRHVDKLVKVCNRQGKEECILIHVEVQGYAQEEFPERMFQYFSRIREKYQLPITAFAIFTEDDKSFRPDRYELNYRGTRLLYVYNTLKIMDMDEELLKKSDNPFAYVILTVKTALKKKKLTEEQLYGLKFGIMKQLLQKNFSKKKIGRLLMFLEHYIRFNDKSLNDRFKQEKELLIKGRKQSMGIVEKIHEFDLREAEETAMKKGMEKGMEKGMKRSIRNLILKLGFSDEKIAEVMEVSVSLVKDVRASLRLG